MIPKLGLFLSLVTLGALFGCSQQAGGGASDPHSGDSGTVRLNAVAAANLGIEELSYSIQVPDQDAIKGTKAVDEDGTVVIEEEVPAAEGVVISLSAAGDDGVSCAGESSIAVVAGETVSVSIVLQCKLRDGTIVPTGAIDVDARFNICPQVQKASAEPAEDAFALTVTAQDLDGEEGGLSYSWTATSGSFADDAAAGTTYTCGAAGPQVLTVTVTDKDGCSHSSEVDLSCAGAPPLDAGVPPGGGFPGFPPGDGGFMFPPLLDGGTGFPWGDGPPPGFPGLDGGTPPFGQFPFPVGDAGFPFGGFPFLDGGIPPFLGG